MTGAEIAVKVVHPATGEIFTLDQPTAVLAKAVWECREFEDTRLRTFKRAVGDELLRRLDQQAKWTLNEGGYVIKGESPAPKTEYDVQELKRVLDELCNEQKISKDARDAAIEMTVSYRARHAGVQRLLKLGGEIAERIEKVKREVERDRRPPSVRPA